MIFNGQQYFSNYNMLIFRNKGMSLSSSVSFRQGANVEFAGPAFVSTGDGKSGHDEVSYRTMSEQSCTKFYQCISFQISIIFNEFHITD